MRYVEITAVSPATTNVSNLEVIMASIPDTIQIIVNVKPTMIVNKAGIP
jgi:hypothetical protein